jgi:hypothetical protein
VPYINTHGRRGAGQQLEIDMATIDYSANEFGDILLADGRSVRLIQQAYKENDGYGSDAWFAYGYLSTETPEDETGPTVEVCWESLGEDEAENDADWANPDSITHYSLGELVAA